MTFLDLCAGIGGFSLGLERAGMTCKGQVEIDGFCNKVLAKHWPDVPRWKDIKALNIANLPPVDLICGGYPCQPFSCAGERRGADDDRHLWPYFLRIIKILVPAWCFFENVAGHVTLGLDQVLSDLESVGYTAWPVIVPAVAVDALHRRDRVWIIAHFDSIRKQQSKGIKQKKRRRGDNGATEIGNAPDPIGNRRQRKEKDRSLSVKKLSIETSMGTWRPWPTESCLVRMVHGVSNRLDGYRIKALGNAVVPVRVEVLGRGIIASSEGYVYE